MWNWDWLKGHLMSVGEATTEVDGVSRRDFLRAGSLTVVSMSSVARAKSLAAVPDRRAILILMSGGASQLETFDPKPDAPAAIRGPFKSIGTAVPGLRFGESLPRLAQQADRFAVIRSMNHDAAPIHETGHQLIQTGSLSYSDVQYPHWGSVVARANGSRNGLPTNIILPKLIGDTGVNAYRGQQSGILGSEWEPTVDATLPSDEPESMRRLYGDTSFGRSLLRARQLVERGSRCVTVNLFPTLNQQITWDCHGDKSCGPATLFDYQDRLCPEFDQAMSGLISDLGQRGLLDSTLVVATGEFGRTPNVNENVGRDHWTSCWSAMVAGGRINGGCVIGSSNSTAAEPVDRPVNPGELTATLLAWCGVDTESQLIQSNGQPEPLIPHSPLMELWN